MPEAVRLAATAAVVGCWSGRPNASSTATPLAAPIASARNSSAGRSTDSRMRSPTKSASRTAPARRQRVPTKGARIMNDAASDAIDDVDRDDSRCTPARERSRWRPPGERRDRAR